MKKFLKTIISIAIVVALILGVSYFVSKNKSGEAFYAKLETKQTNNSIKKESSEDGFDSLISYIKNNNSKFDDTVTQATAEGGELSLLRKIYASCDQNFEYFTNMLSLATQNNSSEQKAILSSYDKLVEQIKVHQASLNNATKMTQSASSFNKVDFKLAFNTFLDDYSKSVEIYSSLCNDMAKYVYKNVYNNFTTDYNFVLNTICVKMNEFTSKNHNLLSQNKLMHDNLDYYSAAPNYAIVNAFLEIDDIDEFFKSEDKGEFIQSKENKSPYQELNNFFREV